MKRQSHLDRQQTIHLGSFYTPKQESKMSLIFIV